jgi:hypothetical protein
MLWRAELGVQDIERFLADFVGLNFASRSWFMK